MESRLWNGDLGNGRYRNPILYADYSDPDAVRVGEDYFMVASSFCNVPGLPLLHSKDLVNWKVVNYILPVLPDGRYDRPVHGCGVWAPAIRRHGGLFYVCFPMPDEGIFMTTAADPFGAWSEPVNIRPGAGWIDPCPFWDEDGRAYLVSGVARSRIGYKSVLYMSEMRPDGRGLLGEPVKIFDGRENGQDTIEGPKLYKRNGWYYVFAPAGGVKTGWQTVLRSRRIFGPYEYRVVMRQGNTAVNGPHQGAWVDTVTGEDWFLHFQDVYAAGRIVHLQPMSWREDWPVIGEPEEGTDYGVPVEEYRKPDVGSVSRTAAVCEPEASDDFSGEGLGLQWQWNANPRESWYELTGKSLRLFSAAQEQGTARGDYPNLLLQKWPAPEFTCVTQLDIGALCEGDEAGVISMGMEYAAFVLRREESGMQAEFVRGTQKFGKILAEKTKERTSALGTVNGRRLFVRCRVRQTGKRKLAGGEGCFALETVTLEYSTDGKNYLLAGEAAAVPGRWVGVKSGVFCSRRAPGCGGFLEVHSVIYSRP